MSGDTPTGDMERDVLKVTATLIVKFVVGRSHEDSEVSDAWCRITAALGVKFDPRPHLDEALAAMGERGEP